MEYTTCSYTQEQNSMRLPLPFGHLPVLSVCPLTHISSMHENQFKPQWICGRHRPAQLFLSLLRSHKGHPKTLMYQVHVTENIHETWRVTFNITWPGFGEGNEIMAGQILFSYPLTSQELWPNKSYIDFIFTVWLQYSEWVNEQKAAQGSTVIE